MKVGMSSITPPKQVKTSAKSSSILEEIQKFKMLKSQGVLNSAPTESTVESPLYTMHKSAFQPLINKLEEERRLSSSLVQTTSYSKSPQKNDSFTTPKKNPTGYYKHGSTPHLNSPPSSIKKSPTNSVASMSSQKSPKSWNASALARNYSDLSLMSNKSKGTMTYSAFTMADAESDISILSNLREKYTEPDNLDDSRLRTILKKPIYSESSRSSPFRPESTLKTWDRFTAPKKRYSNIEVGRNRITTAERIINNSRAEFKPKVTKRAKSPAKKSEMLELVAEVERWRGFGKDMAKAYNELNQKFRQFISNKNSNATSSTEALNEEVGQLRKELTKYQSENAKMKFTTSPGALKSLGTQDIPKKSAQLREKIEAIRKENQNAKATLEFLKDENEILQKSTVDVKKYKAESEYYKSLTESKFKECSTLAEEVIGLRAQLDRSHSNYLKYQRSRTEAVNSEGDLEPKTRPRESSLKKSKTINSPSKKGVKWKDELIEKSPRGTAQSMRATR